MSEQTDDVLADIDAALEGWHGRDASIGPDAMRWAPERPAVGALPADTQAHIEMQVSWRLWSQDRTLARRMLLESWYRYVASNGAMAKPGTEPKVDVGSFPPVDEHGHITVLVVGRVVPAH